MPTERVAEFYEEATRGRSASHHLQVKAALALLYDFLGTTSPFAQCEVPKFARKNIKLRYHTASQLGHCYVSCARIAAATLGMLTYYLATALFYRLPISRVGATHDRPARA